MRVAEIACALLFMGCAPPATPPVTPAEIATPVAAPTNPPSAQKPAEEIPLSFEQGLFRLEGTLSLPARAEGQRVPGIVIVHGSGPMSRDGVMHGQIGLGFGFEIAVYKEIAAALTARGFAVYRYDKRSCNAWNGCKDDGSAKLPYGIAVTELQTEKLVADAEAAMDTLGQRPEIDPDRLFFVGHSEGAELTPLLLHQRPSVRAGVMLAPPFHTMGVVLQQQSERLRWAFTAAGDPARADIEGRALAEAALALKRIEEGNHLGGPILGQPADLWASWIEVAKKVPPIARDLERPLLILGGAYDYNVAPSEIEAWSQWLASTTKAHHRVQLLPCVTHALNCIAKEDPSRLTEADIGHHVSTELLAEITRFLEGVMASPR